MKNLFILVLSLTLSLSFFSYSYAQFIDDNIRKLNDQSYFKSKHKEGDALIEYGNYNKALEVFLELDGLYNTKSDPEKYPNLKFKVGQCYVNSTLNKTKAIPYLEIAKTHVSPDNTGKSDDTTAAILTFFCLGKAYHYNNQIVSAIDNFKKYKYYINKYYKKENKDKLLSEVDRQIEMCYTAKKLMLNPLDIKIDNLGKPINSEFQEYAPIISADGDLLIFTAGLPNSTGGKKDIAGKYFEDIYSSELKSNGEWSKPKKISENINSEFHEASVSLSLDGQYLIIYHDDDGDGNIYMSRRVNDVWGEPEDLGDEINSLYQESHACLSPDNNTLYFVSDRKGGFGGKDIWSSERLASGKWSKPVNLGSKINTEYDEEAPFVISDGVTMYFCSKGHESMGGYDIFISTLSEYGLWSVPENIGYPINTTDEDLFYVPSPNEKYAFYSSENYESVGARDIFKITILKDKDQVAKLKGIIFDADTYQPIKGSIKIIEKESGETIADLVSDPKTGEYYVTLPINKNYEINVNAYKYQEYKESIFIERPVEINKAIMVKRK